MSDAFAMSHLVETHSKHSNTFDRKIAKKQWQEYRHK